MFKRKNHQTKAPLTGLRAIPVLGELYELGPLIPRILDVFKDNRGKMSSKRFGAGALVSAGIALVDAGAQAANTWQFYGGLGLCGLGVVLFGLTRWEGGTGDAGQPGGPD